MFSNLIYFFFQFIADFFEYCTDKRTYTYYILSNSFFFLFVTIYIVTIHRLPVYRSQSCIAEKKNQINATDYVFAGDSGSIYTLVKTSKSAYTIPLPRPRGSLNIYVRKHRRRPFSLNL